MWLLSSYQGVVNLSATNYMHSGGSATNYTYKLRSGGSATNYIYKLRTTNYIYKSGIYIATQIIYNILMLINLGKKILKK